MKNPYKNCCYPLFNFLSVFVLVCLLSIISSSLSWSAEPNSEEESEGLKVRIVLFHPSDVQPKGAQQQLTKVANYADHYFPFWLNHWGYKTEGKIPFSRDPKGDIEVVFIKGDHPEGSPYYRATDGKIAKGAVKRIFDEIKKKSDVSSKNQVVWIFLHKVLGENAGLSIGRGSTTSGGVCYVKFRPDAPFSNTTDIDSVEGRIAGLRGAIHELGHALGLPHNGSHSKLKLGSSLMGKPDRSYKKKHPNDKRVYLSKASAAIAWKSSVFAGPHKLEIRNQIPKLQFIEECRFSYDKKNDQIKVVGKIRSDIKAHSIVIANHPESNQSSYRHKFFAARINQDGTFEIMVDELEHSNGYFTIAFCFNNGFVGGNPNSRRSNMKSGFTRNYEFKNEEFHFDKSWNTKKSSN